MKQFTFLPQDDLEQAIRIRRLLLSAGYSVFYPIALAVSYWQNALSGQLLLEASAQIILAVSLFFILFRLGVNKRFQDRSMTAAQLLSRIAIQLYVIYFAPETRALFSIFLLISFMFAMLRLPTRDLLLLGATALLGYLVIIILHYMAGESSATLRADILEWFALAIILPWFILMDSRLRRLRNDLRDTSFKLEDTQNLAQRDELTGAFNRRFLMTAMQNEKQRCDPTRETFCICIIDIDHFKNVNDTVGHLAGDEVLRVFAQHFMHVSRKTDIFGRYGGEEFMLILCNTSLENALAHAERMRHDVEQLRFTNLADNFRITTSIGVAQYEKNEPLLQTFARADEALYQAKSAGRNQVGGRIHSATVDATALHTPDGKPTLSQLN